MTTQPPSSVSPMLPAGMSRLLMAKRSQVREYKLSEVHPVLKRIQWSKDKSNVDKAFVPMPAQTIVKGLGLTSLLIRHFPIKGPNKGESRFLSADINAATGKIERIAIERGLSNSEHSGILQRCTAKMKEHEYEIEEQKSVMAAELQRARETARTEWEKQNARPKQSNWSSLSRLFQGKKTRPQEPLNAKAEAEFDEFFEPTKQKLQAEYEARVKRLVHKRERYSNQLQIFLARNAFQTIQEWQTTPDNRSEFPQLSAKDQADMKNSWLGP